VRGSGRKKVYGVGRPKRLRLLHEHILRRMRKGWTLGEIADDLGCTRAQLQYWRESDPAFNAQCLDALEHGTDIMEGEARRRAVDGVQEPVFYKGEVCGEVTRYSDKLLQFMLTVRRYKSAGQLPPPAAVTPPIESTPREVAELERMTDAELAALYSEALEKAAAAKR